MANERKKLLSLMALMTRYTLQMASDDCGGLSEYCEFFSKQRKIFSINGQRKELSQEVRDVYNLVESTFYEEQRKIQSLDRIESDKSDKRKARFETIITVVSSITLPIVLISGIFGMNNTDLPDISWMIIMSIAMVISVSLLAVFLTLTYASTLCGRENIQLKTYLQQKRNELETLMVHDVIGEMNQTK